MNDPLFAHGWCIFLALCMAVGLNIIKGVVERWHAGGRIPKDMARWKNELLHAAHEAMEADMNAAEKRVRLCALIGSLPNDYDPSALLGIQLAAGIHRAVLAEAEARGFVKPGLTNQVYGDIVPAPLSPQSQEPAPPAQPALDAWMRPIDKPSNGHVEN